MCFSELVRALQGIGINATASQLRWALASGKVAKPSLDGSLNYHYTNEHLKEFRQYFDEMKVRQSKGQKPGRVAMMV
jgi:hypothetical protein